MRRTSSTSCERRTGQSRQIPYRLSKIHGFAQPQGVTFRVTAETTADDLRGSTRIDMAAGPEHGWTARSLAPWLLVDTESGVTGSEVRFHVDPAIAGAIFEDPAPFGEILITGDTEGMTSRKVTVHLQLALPAARVAMPVDQPAGPVRRFRVHGMGFTEEALASGRLAVEGVPGAVFTRLTDEDVTVQLPASLPAGTYRVVTSNTLEVPVSSAVVRLTAPVETARAVLPGDGANGHMLWDGARSALWVLEPLPSGNYDESYHLRRHALREGVWTFVDQPVQRLRRMGFSPDGERLVANSDPSGTDPARIYTFDPETLGVGMYTSLSDQVPEPPSRAPLAVTVDGRVWTGALNTLLTYDSFTRYNLRLVPLSTCGFDPYIDSPPSTMASRDGGRLLVSRGPARPFAYLDVADGVAGDTCLANAAGATTFDGISDDGGRVLSGANVYDGDFTLLGTLPGPGIVSGDGRRAFTVEGRSDWQVGGPAPVVHVFDLTAPAGGGGTLPELGTVDLLDHATCAAGERACAPTSTLAATPDGRVLFAQTEGGVVVVPIPESLLGP